MNEINLNELKTEKPLKLIAFLLGFLSMVVACVVLQSLKTMLMPFCIALFILYLAEPLQSLLIRKKVPQKLRIGLVLLTTAMLLYLVGQLVYSNVLALSKQLPHYEANLIRILSEAADQLALPSDYFSDLQENFRWEDHLQSGTFNNLIQQAFGNAINFITNSFLVLLFLVYLLFEREVFLNRIQKSFKPEDAERITAILVRIHQQIVNYLDVKTLVSLMTGGLITVILLLFGVDFALFWGIVAFLLNYIPSIGSIIATLPPFAIALVQFENVVMPFAVLVLTGIVQIFMGNVLEPRMMGTRLGLSPLVVILSLLFWGWLWGPVGMILSVPIVAAIAIVCDNFESLRPFARLISHQR